MENCKRETMDEGDEELCGSGETLTGGLLLRRNMEGAGSSPRPCKPHRLHDARELFRSHNARKQVGIKFLNWPASRSGAGDRC